MKFTNIICIAIGIIMLLSGNVNALTIWDESKASPIPFTWNSSNFDGFVGNISDNLTITQNGLGAASGKTRTIEKLNLSYNTKTYLVEYEVSKNNVSCYFYQCYDKHYTKLNLFGETYVALNGKADKLTKLILEQKGDEQKILQVGDTWSMGNGWTLKAQSIDARASPRMAWLVLSKNGVKKDDKVISQGQVYKYTQTFGGETDVPFFVTYVDGVFAGQTEDYIVLKYSWLISDDVTYVNLNDNFGNLTVVEISNNALNFNNKYSPISLNSNSTINIVENLKFKVLDNSSYLKFYPTVEPRLNITASQESLQVGKYSNIVFSVTSNGLPVSNSRIKISGAAVGADGVTGSDGKVTMNIIPSYSGVIIAEAQKSGYTKAKTELKAYSLSNSPIASWNLSENYVLSLIDIDNRASPRLARFELSKNGTIVKDTTVISGSVFKYCPSQNCIFNATINSIFNGTQGNAAKLTNITQYSETNGSIILNKNSYLLSSGNFTGISWFIKEGYELKMVDIDIISTPRLVWLQVLKNGTVKDDAMISMKEWYNSSILNVKIDGIFKGETSSAVKLVNVSQYSEINGSILLNNIEYIYIIGTIYKIDKPLYEGYNLSVLGIDYYAYPRMAWLRLYKNDNLVDEKFVIDREIYSYNNKSKTILYAEINGIFTGYNLHAIKFDNVTQYSEINDTKIIDGKTYTIIIKGEPVSIPKPLPEPIYEKYEVRGNVWENSYPNIWNAQNFAGFFYDLKDNFGTETLTILQTDLNNNQRTIDKNRLIYNTTAQPKTLNVVFYGLGITNWESNDAYYTNLATSRGLEQASDGLAFDNGKYWIVGWNGKKHVAINGKVNKLSKFLFEHGTSISDKKTLVVGETWELGDGLTLTLQSVDAKTSPRQAWLVLGKDGIKKKDIFVSEKKIYTYVEKSIGNETDVPLFVTYIDSVFAGATTDMVQLKYTWVISPSIIEINSTDNYGIFGNATIENKKLSLSNNVPIALAKDSTQKITDNFRFEVANSDSLRFMPVLLKSPDSQVYEIRGEVWNGTQKLEWNNSNFAGFFYDFKGNLGNESIKLDDAYLKYSRLIPKNALVYTTIASPQMLQVVEHAFSGNVTAAKNAGLEGTGINYVMGWKGEKHIAFNDKINKPAKLILENNLNDKKTLTIGETWELGDGWTLKAQSIDAKASPRQAWLVLSKDGVKKDDKIVSDKRVYTYVENNINGENDVPIFVTYADGIFAGANTDMVQLKYSWLLGNATEIKFGEKVERWNFKTQMIL